MQENKVHHTSVVCQSVLKTDQKYVEAGYLHWDKGKKLLLWSGYIVTTLISRGKIEGIIACLMIKFLYKNKQN